MAHEHVDEIVFLQQNKMKKMRICKKPYIVRFLRKKICVKPEVFYPATDTKLLAQSTIIKSAEKVLEVFAGTGAISIFCAPKAAKIVATDINPKAIDNINENIHLHKLKRKMKAVCANIFPAKNETFDVIILNPPYTDKKARNIIEKSMWDENHAAIKRFFKNANNYLTPRGKIYASWANFSDFFFFEELIRKNGFQFKRINELSKDGKIYRVYEIKSE